MTGEVDPETLEARLGDEDAPLVIDVSPAEDFAAGHLPGSEHVPLADLPGEIDRIAEADHVVTVCPHGIASVKAARIVGAYREFEGRVESLAGGLEAWDGPLESGDQEDGPLESGDQEDGTRGDGRGRRTDDRDEDAPDAPF